MSENSTVTACCLIIGNEVLSGRTKDANLGWLAERLTNMGIRMAEARVIPDVEDVIINAVNEARKQFTYVFTTGGIGPTHDDITADCIAAAFGRELEMHPEAVEIIKQREAPPEVMVSRLRMARIPVGATLIENTLNGPPGFQLENVFVMAGVPLVMQAMVGTLDKDRIKGALPMRSRSIGANLGESQVAAKLREIQDEHPDVDLGSYPYYRKDVYGTNLVMRGTDESELEIMLEKVRQMIVGFGGEPIVEKKVAE